MLHLAYQSFSRSKDGELAHSPICWCRPAGTQPFFLEGVYAWRELEDLYEVPS